MKKRLSQGGEVTAISASINGLILDARSMIERTSGAFRHSSLEEMKNIWDCSSRASVTECGLINSVLDLKRVDDAKKKSLIGTIGHIGRICACSAELANRVRSKIERDILFSVQAFGECVELFAEAAGTVSAIAKLVENGVERSEVERLCRVLDKHIYEGEMRHEERLIKGVCAVKSSELFTGMLDLFRAIAFHSSRAVAGLVGGEPGFVR